ncbi:MAG: DUF3108 domain-containing protein [Gemmatimonadota bacterium]
MKALRGWLPLLSLVIATGYGAVPAQAQANGAAPGNGGAQVDGVDDTVTWPSTHIPMPWGPGERLGYKLKFGWFNAGHGTMEVEGVENVRGKASYRIKWTLDGGLLGADVHDRYTSYVDVENITSRRFIQDIHEFRYKRHREYEIFPEEKRWERTDNDDAETMEATAPLDDIAFVYYVRALPLQVGDVDTLPLYFKDSGNPVIVKTLRIETKEVPAGKFETIVVQPLIRTSGLFGEGGKAELYFTNDERRILVYMKSELSIGSLSLHLESIEEGRPITQDFLRMQQSLLRRGQPGGP